MFSFLGSIVGKIASAVASVFVAVGLISAPASVTPPSATEPVIIENAATTAEIQQEEVKKEADVKAELDALKKQLADEQKKRKDLEKKSVTPKPTPAPAPAPVPQTASVVAPIVTPPTAPIPTPAPAAPAIILLPGQFMLPSGAIVDSTGKVVKPAPVSQNSQNTNTATTTPATPPPAPPAPVWPPADGSTVDIQRSVLSVINFNTQLTCDQLLSLPPSKKDLCKLYKDNEGNNKYTWRIVEDL